MAGERRQDRPPAPRVSGGEQPFIEALAARYRGALTRFFERRAPQLRSESEDLTQEVFLRLASRGESERIERIDGYIFQTASSVLTDRARRNAATTAPSRWRRTCRRAPRSRMPSHEAWLSRLDQGEQAQAVR